MYRSVILSILFLLVCSVPLQAQEAHELQGRVLNSSDNPIAKVQILDQATGLLLTETGKGGEFQLSFPDSVARISLVFLAEGYQPKVMLLRPSSQLYRIILFEVQRSIEGVTVTRRRLLPISGYAPLTSRFTTLDILMTPRALGDILGGLMEDPDAQSSDTDGRLSLQGGAPHESQVYIDGLRLPNPYSISSKNSSVRSLLSPSECKEINLLSGGYSASMGQALSGVIQILSRDTKDVKPGSFVSLSNIGPSFTWALGAPSSATKLELSASYTDLSLYDRVLPSAYPYTRSFYSPSLTASLWHDLPQATLKAQLSYTRMGIGYRPNASMPTFNSRLREDRYYGRLTYVRSLSTACQLEVGAHTQYSDFSGSSLVSPQDQVLDHDLYAEARLALKYSGEPFSILGGFDYSWRDYRETYELTGDRYQLNFSNHLPVSFLEFSYLHRGLSLSAGLRGEYASVLSVWSLSPRLYAGYRLGKHVFSASWGRYTQLPEKEILRFMPALKSSRSEISQLSYSYGDKTPLLQLSLFYKSYQHLTRSLAEGYPKQFDDQGGGETYGLTLFHKGNLGSIDYSTSYSYTQARLSYDRYLRPLAPSYVSPHTFRLTAKYWSGALKSLLGCSYYIDAGAKGYSYDLTPIQLPRRSRLDLSWSYLPSKRVLLHMGCTNVLGTTNYWGIEPDPLSPTEGTRISTPSTRFFYIGCFITLSGNQKKTP
ncbi:MAG: TonB-dependent receptor [Porphyromonas sp.]|uniref:TonB-dependent receptor n=1 Tax=Porphyromonas sp. TaxID=1924944 RepID=UPI001CB6068B|nr:TonB-dependent receptor [Porphyromonas sp.]MBF1413601.1 TonB-dependent receptor [Porphyromonas sp.]